MSLPLHLPLVRALAVGAVVPLFLAACAHHPLERPSGTVQPFVSDVTDEEWLAAIPAKGSKVAQPRLLRGMSHPDGQGVLLLGETATAVVAIVIRADGTVGLRRVVASTNPRFTERVIHTLRSQVYEPPLLNGSPVATRGEVSFKVTRTE